MNNKKYINELSEEEFTNLKKDISAVIWSTNQSIVRTADIHNVDRNDVYDVLLANLQMFFKNNDLNEYKLMTKKEMLKMLSPLTNVLLKILKEG